MSTLKSTPMPSGMKYLVLARTCTYYCASYLLLEYFNLVVLPTKVEMLLISIFLPTFVRLCFEDLSATEEQTVFIQVLICEHRHVGMDLSARICLRW